MPKPRLKLYVRYLPIYLYECLLYIKLTAAVIPLNLKCEISYTHLDMPQLYF